MRRSLDHYSQAAISAGYGSRAVYKLQELDRKHRLIRPNDTVVDLGAVSEGSQQPTKPASQPQPVSSSQLQATDSSTPLSVVVLLSESRQLDVVCFSVCGTGRASAGSRHTASHTKVDTDQWHYSHRTSSAWTLSSFAANQWQPSMLSSLTQSLAARSCPSVSCVVV